MRLYVCDKFFQVFGFGHLGVDLGPGKQSTEHKSDGCVYNGV